MNNNSCERLFPSWYKTIDPALTTDTVNNRIAAIRSILENTEVEFWLDVVRIALGTDARDKATKMTLEEKFVEFDVTFDLVSNENLIKTLSEILLCFLIETRSALAYLVATLISNINFLEQFSTSRIPYLSRAIDLLNTSKDRENPDGEIVDIPVCLQTNLDNSLESIFRFIKLLIFGLDTGFCAVSGSDF